MWPKHGVHLHHAALRVFALAAPTRLQAIRFPGVRPVRTSLLVLLLVIVGVVLLSLVLAVIRAVLPILVVATVLALIALSLSPRLRSALLRRLAGRRNRL